MSNIIDYVSNDIDPISLTLSVGETESTVALFRGGFLTGYETPANLTPVSFTFLGSIDGGTTFNPVYDKENALVTSGTGVSRTIELDLRTFFRLNAIKFVANTAQLVTPAIIRIKVRPV